jgi:hypothetical protein
VRGGVLEGGALRREGAAAHVGEGALVRRDQAEARAEFHGQVAQREPRLDVERATASPANSIAWPTPAAAPSRPMMCSARSLAVTPAPARRRSGCASAWAFAGAGLRGQRVRALGTHAEGQRAEAAVGAGVAVAADHGEARQHDAQLRAHHVHDALLPGWPRSKKARPTSR